MNSIIRPKVALTTATTLFTVVMVLSAALVIIYSASNPAELPWFKAVANFYFYAAVATFALVGFAILRRDSRNPVGWIMIALGAGGALPIFGGAYNLHELPGRDWIGWLVVLETMSVWGFVALMLLVFPTGRVPSRRWKPVAALVLLFVIVMTLVGAFAPWTYAAQPSSFVAMNPIGWGDESWAVEQVDQLSFMGVVFVLIAVGSVIFRWRSSVGDERQQLKWLGQAGLIFVILVLAGNVISVVVGEESAPSFLVGFGLQMLGVVGLPLSIGFAVSRYRLYDVDRIINRTLVYSLLTLSLAVVFGAFVVLPQILIVGTAAGSSLGVVLVATATLAVAAAFNPLRRRVQAVVDRRFNRNRYDARRVVAQFRDRLKAPQDLGTLIDDVSNVVSSTLAPESFGFWSAKDRPV